MFPLDSFVRFSLPVRYYRIKSFEKDGKLYKMVGIIKAKEIFSRSQTIKYSGKRIDLIKLEQKMMLAEKHHFLAFIILIVIVIYSLISSMRYFATALLIFDILLHGYPVMIQRYNRARLTRILEKHNKAL